MQNEISQHTIFVKINTILKCFQNMSVMTIVIEGKTKHWFTRIIEISIIILFSGYKTNLSPGDPI